MEDREREQQHVKDQGLQSITQLWARRQPLVIAIGDHEHSGLFVSHLARVYE